MKQEREAMGKDVAVYHSCIFLLSGDGQILQVSHCRYVAIVRGEEVLPQFAGQRLRLADWYAAVEVGGILRIENETYTYLAFDRQGRACPPDGDLPEQQRFWQPDAVEWQAMRRTLDTAATD